MIQNGDGCELELVSADDESDHRQGLKRKKAGAIEVLKSKLDQSLVKDIESLESPSAVGFNIKDKRFEK